MAGQLVTDELGYGGGRRVTAYVPPARPEAIVFAGDGQLIASWGASCNGVTCQLALMDVADLNAALASIRRVLKPGGWFVFVIAHPCLLGPHAPPQSMTTVALRAGLGAQAAVSTAMRAPHWRCVSGCSERCSSGATT